MQNHPRATYRVQLHPGFTFRHTAEVVDYLADLGISHLYTSPCLQAAPGSTHGYDVVDFTAVSGELGGEEGRRELCAALARRGMGQVVDLVPNHMAASVPRNRWWTSTLASGRRGKYAKFFDVDWHPPGARIRNRVLLPVLGGHYGRELERGRIRLVRRRDGVYVQYFEHLFPVSPGSLRRLEETAGGERARASRAGALDAVLEELNRDQEALDAFLERQHYRLCSWRASGTVLGYRRFFDINSMVALRMAEPEVFREAHRLALGWVRDGEVQGLRVDHPDGLRDPAGYFQTLRREAPRAWIVAEKILLPGERLPGSWPVQGTTGYEFMNLASGLFVDPAGERALEACYRRFSGETRAFREVLRDAKRKVVGEVLGGGLNRLTALLSRTCERHLVARDFTPDQLRDALRELVTCLPVYRTYIDAEQGLISPEDARLVERAAGAGSADPEVMEYIRDLLLLLHTGPEETEFVMRFQQFTGPAMAKGGEDTALYRYHRLTALNEVGGDPGRFGASLEEFHTSMAERAGTQPSAMLASSTHDTKRSEDVRARLALLSEIPLAWEEAVFRWAKRAGKHRADGIPDANTEYLLYQTLVGAWPIDRERAAAYLEKAAREAKVHTSWTAPDPAYEEGLRGFVSALYRDRELMDDLASFANGLVAPGRVNSLAQTLIKLTVPGVPDIYQGCELWDLSLVDPDNRRPVDFDLRRALLRELEELEAGGGEDLPERILQQMDRGLPKLWVVRQALRLRAERPGLFAPGSGYTPLPVHGARSGHLVAFLRGGGTGSAGGTGAPAGTAAVLAPRFPILLGGSWQDTGVELPEGAWRNLLTGERVTGGPAAAGDLLRRFPAVLLAAGD